MRPLKQRKKTPNYEGSSEHLRKQHDIRKMIQIRLQIMIGILVVLAGVLIYRLYQIQIIEHDHFMTLLENAQIPNFTVDTMRGEFFDRNGEVLVSNKSINSIVYYPEKAKIKKWDLARRFAEHFEIEDDLKKDDLVNLWLLLNDNGKSLITEEEQKAFYEKKIDQEELDKMKYRRVTEEMTSKLSPEDRKAFKVYYAMQTATISQAATILEDASVEEIAYLAEHSDLFPGFSFMTSWEREYHKDLGLKTLIGSVSDIPAEKLEHYLAMGYRRNDKVGSYGLEYQYEELLSGIKSEYQHKDLKLEKPGKKGHDLKLAIDADLQNFVEKTLENTIEKHHTEPRRKPMKAMHMVVSDPNTGDILAIAAINRDSKGKYYNDPQAVLLNAFPMGSTVKGATVYMGLDQEVMKPGEKINDTPMYISGTPPRHSYRNLGPVDDVSSLQLSSNVYMFHIAIRLGGSQYIPNGPLRFPNPEETYALMRNYYSQFGLGVETQIDFPREALGYKGNTKNSGSLLEFSVGQFDNYNAMQLNQYIATIANGGYRLKPRLVTEALNRDHTGTVYENNVEILNEIENKEALARVQEGMRQCVVTGNCGPLMYKSYTSAAKTGTAQDFHADYKGIVRHNTFVAYAPFENPEIAVSCVAPYTYLESGGYPLQNLCTVVTAEVLDYYMQK